jgi:dihydropteroate synthase
MSYNRHSFHLHSPRTYSLNCRGKLLQLRQPVVMGILNVSPESFYDGGKFIEENSILEKARDLVTNGAQIIDIGGASSRPGATIIPFEEERQRLIPAIKLVSAHFPSVFISADTWRARLADEAIHAGAHIINDISGGELDKEMFNTVARLKVPYILMHMKGIPENMQNDPVYPDVMEELLLYFQKKIYDLRQAGVQDIIADPGFGFGKSVADNYRILAHIELLHQLDCPVLAGFSRKSMINKVLGTSPETALNGTSVLNTIALMNGVQILRVHDAKEALECIKIVEAFQAQQS